MTVAELGWVSAQAGIDDGALSGDERARVAALRRDDDRATRTASFALRRAMLARHTGTPPEALAFDRRCRRCGDRSHGPPRLTGRHAGLRFSASSSTGIAVVGVARNQLIGVDVEGERPDRAWRAVAPLLAHAHDDPRRSTHELWTAKEAVVKALGAGLAVPLDTVCVAGGAAYVTVDGRRWTFALQWVRLIEWYLAAIATPRAAVLEVRRWG